MNRADAPPVRDDGLQIEEHRAFQERFWTMERAAWGVFVLLILVALYGWTGSGGPGATRTLTFEGGDVEFPTVTRWQISDDMHVSAQADAGGKTAILFGSDFVHDFEIASIEPRPSRSMATARGHIYEFEAEPGQTNHFLFHIRANRPGLFHYEFGPAAQPQMASTLVLP